MSILKYIVPISSKEDSKVLQTSGNKAQVIYFTQVLVASRIFPFNECMIALIMRGSNQAVKNCAYTCTTIR